jgi:hypothetical protein
MNSSIEDLVRSLLFEGYALYPYTPGVKNATPTPFGIVYPPAYAEAQPAAFSMLRLEAVVEAGPDARLSGTVLFLQATGERHEATERSLELGPVTLADLARGPLREAFGFPMDDGELRGRVAMRAEPLSADLARIRLCVHNETEIPDAEEASRGEALRRGLVSTHPLLEVERGRFISPLERHGAEGEAALANEPVNTFPVLVGDQDAAVLGAAIVLPDHPELAPESLGNLFDNTEIEEALLLHVHALSDDERDQIAGQDPAVREMIERAESTTGDEIMGLHGRLTYTEPEADQQIAGSGGPPKPPPGLDQIQGEKEIAAAGTTVRLGDKIVLRPGTEGDVYDKILHGRTATVERIYRGYDERIYLGVTVDDDPGQELLRETGRFLFFFADEVEPVAR